MFDCLFVTRGSSGGRQFADLGLEVKMCLTLAALQNTPLNSELVILKNVSVIDMTSNDICPFWHSQSGLPQSFLVILYQECSKESKEEEWLHRLFGFSGFPFEYNGY